MSCSGWPEALLSRLVVYSPEDPVIDHGVESHRVAGSAAAKVRSDLAPCLAAATSRAVALWTTSPHCTIILKAGVHRAVARAHLSIPLQCANGTAPLTAAYILPV